MSEHLDHGWKTPGLSGALPDGSAALVINIVMFMTKATGGDRSVAEEVLGHNSKKVSNRYFHLGEELEAQIKNRDQGDDVEVEPIVFG